MRPLSGFDLVLYSAKILLAKNKYMLFDLFRARDILINFMVNTAETQTL